MAMNNFDFFDEQFKPLDFFFTQKLMHGIYTFTIKFVPRLALEFSPLGHDV
jgi:hypothetical protein